MALLPDKIHLAVGNKTAELARIEARRRYRAHISQETADLYSEGPQAGSEDNHWLGTLAEAAFAAWTGRVWTGFGEAGRYLRDVHPFEIRAGGWPASPLYVPEKAEKDAPYVLLVLPVHRNEIPDLYGVRTLILVGFMYAQQAFDEGIRKEYHTRDGRLTVEYEVAQVKLRAWHDGLLPGEPY